LQLTLIPHLRTGVVAIIGDGPVRRPGGDRRRIITGPDIGRRIILIRYILVISKESGFPATGNGAGRLWAGNESGYAAIGNTANEKSIFPASIKYRTGFYFPVKNFKSRRFIGATFRHGLFYKIGAWVCTWIKNDLVKLN